MYNNNKYMHRRITKKSLQNQLDPIFFLLRTWNKVNLTLLESWNFDY